MLNYDLDDIMDEEVRPKDKSKKRFVRNIYTLTEKELSELSAKEKAQVTVKALAGRKKVREATMKEYDISRGRRYRVIPNENSVINM